MKPLVLVAALFLFAGMAQAQTHQAALSWTASPTTTVTGYNVYRITGVCPSNPTLGAFTKLSSTTATVLSYTAFTSGGESGFSGTLQATVPLFTASAAPAPPGPLNGAVQ